MLWAIHFMKCMRSEYRYPDGIGNVVKELEKQLIGLYAKVGVIVYENKLKEEEEQEKENMEWTAKGRCLRSRDVIARHDIIQGFADIYTERCRLSRRDNQIIFFYFFKFDAKTYRMCMKK